MKTIQLLFLMLILSSATMAQDFSKTCKEQMNLLSFFTGKWKGDATITQQGGLVVQVAQEETIEYKLDSLILQFEGIGRRKNDLTKISFHALAYVSYNAMKNNYEMKSFLMDGKQTEAFFKVVDKNKYDWGFDVTGGKIVYHITVDQTARKWNEKGEFSPNGIQWYPFFEMNLTKEL